MKHVGLRTSWTGDTESQIILADDSNHIIW